jgi:hypothetical protein
MHARDPAEAVEVLNLLLKFFGDGERWIKGRLAIAAVTAVLSARSISSAAITRSKVTRPSGIWPPRESIEVRTLVFFPPGN